MHTLLWEAKLLVPTTLDPLQEMVFGHRQSSPLFAICDGMGVPTASETLIQLTYAAWVLSRFQNSAWVQNIQSRQVHLRFALFDIIPNIHFYRACSLVACAEASDDVGAHARSLPPLPEATCTRGQEASQVHSVRLCC